ncbi:hypothetical protein [Thiococcus pfennigii]|uniref:hypothetical protein n=1 Tax=Thiococcus pfennigii TaxID=1057 RepID=UPI00190362D8|nr:hypothetical protein [Thiococcus pfennigii]MBK1701921.1 hypothetical protein [Thiococcus pfennigii]MBK1730415.1 hypothetical protein [Thiococcus pfennigii]
MDGRNTLSPSAIQRGVSAYRQWKDRIERTVIEFERWLAENDAETPESMAQIQDCLATLRRDRLTVATVAGDPARTATLVNALLFPGHTRPLLPPDGRLPACPIALFWDEAEPSAYLRLLPRADDGPNARSWIHHPLGDDAQEPHARHLQRLLQAATPEAGAWHEALVSLPHPLLQQGLTILILPGLAPADPESAQPPLSRSQAILFALDAEDGIDEADLAFWQHQLQAPLATRRQDIVVSVDRPDPTRTHPGGPPRPTTEKSPNALRREVAEALALPIEQVVPLSLGLGLAARVRQDENLLRLSRLPELERALANQLLAAKHRDLTARLEEGIGALAQGHYAQISGQIIHIQGLIQELEELQGRNAKVQERLSEQTQDHRHQHQTAVARFQTLRDQLLADTAHCREILARPSIDALIEAGHKAMVKSWTTHGLGVAMKDLLDRLRARMQAITDEAERQRRLLRSVYEEFRVEHGFELAAPRAFVPTRYHVELELLYQEAEDLRRTMAFAEQAHVIERFHQRIASRARVLFDRLRLNLDPWLGDALAPLAEAIEHHQATMEQRLESLEQIKRSGSGLTQRIAGLRTEHRALTERLVALRAIDSALYHPPTLDGPSERAGRPEPAAGEPLAPPG